ncbi:MAG TPA: DUF2330 domain-containing protein [Planctomycetaceae bacterium]|nr:DUF2330 domain-containing protein [Planctomycetaceae bacterium]
MTRTWLALSVAGLLLVSSPRSSFAPACCPVPPPGKAVVNADQTVIIVWDAASKTQHFIRQASFKSEADDFGFLVPTPTQPDLAESGNEAFPFLAKVTAPAKQQRPRPPHSSFGCGEEPETKSAASVHVLADKLVAGLQAVVLETKSADALVRWLKEHGYAFSPEVEAWAKPYVEAGWKITALRVAKGRAAGDQRIAASALRMTFKTERPLFPYREPDPKKAAKTLDAQHRLLRIYFLAEARYGGERSNHGAWSGKVAWANKLTAEQRARTLELLKIPETKTPSECWLTEFEDDWSYKGAPADVNFLRAPHQDTVVREPIIEYVSSPWPSDPAVYAFVALIVLNPILRRSRRSRPLQMSP